MQSVFTLVANKPVQAPAIVVTESAGADSVALSEAATQGKFRLQHRLFNQIFRGRQPPLLLPMSVFTRHLLFNRIFSR